MGEAKGTQMKIRTDQAFNGRRVRLGDRAVYCFGAYSMLMGDVNQATAIVCTGFNGDEPEWLPLNYMMREGAATARFVETEGELVPGTWTW